MGRDRDGGDGVQPGQQILKRKMELGKDPGSKLHKSSLATLLLGSIPPPKAWSRGHRGPLLHAHTRVSPAPYCMDERAHPVSIP